MLIRAGFDISVGCTQATPMLLLLSTYPLREKDVLSSTGLRVTGGIVTSEHLDMFGNRMHRVLGQAGTIRLSCDCLVRDTGQPDFQNMAACETPVGILPSEVLVYLLGSRYCETDQLSETAWRLFANVPAGFARVAAICDFVHRHIRFDYASARATHRFGSFQRGAGRVPGFCSPGHRLLPLHEHSGALLHRLSRRHWRAEGSRADGFQRLVRGLARWSLVRV